MNRIRSLAAIVATLAACAMPATTVRTVDTRPGLTVSGAPPGTYLYVDGKNSGPAASYPAGTPDTPEVVLRVESGTHDVEIVDASGQVLFRQRVFVQGETKTIVVH